jgi:hypothetical protein
MMPSFSDRDPTINPVTLWRNIIGMFLGKVRRDSAVAYGTWYGKLPLITQSDKLGTFNCIIGTDHWGLVAQNAHKVA